MPYAHTYIQVASTPIGQIADTGVATSGDSTTAVATAVAANGGAANVVSIAFTAAGLQSLIFLATVNCVVTLTGVTVIDGVTIGTVTLTANVLRRVAAVTGDCSAMSVGANTTGSGAAGTIQINALFNS